MNSHETTYDEQSLSIRDQQRGRLRGRLRTRSFLWTALMGLILLLAQPSALFSHSTATSEASVNSQSVGAASRDGQSDPGGGLFWEAWLVLSPIRQAFGGPLFIMFPIYQPRIGACGRWGCGTNHNETFVRDTIGSTRPKPTNGVVSPKRVDGLNHNETFVRDVIVSQPAGDLSLWLSIEQAFAALPFIPFFEPRVASCNRWGCGTNHNETFVRDTTGSTKLKAAKGVIDPKWVCGLNHNETLVRDVPVRQRSGDWSLLLSIEQAFAGALPFIPSLIYQTGGGQTCPKWVCGANSNETLVRDTAPTKRADDWNLWLRGEQAFARALLFIPVPGYQAGVTCPKWVCGANHNETLVRDAAPMK